MLRTGTVHLFLLLLITVGSIGCYHENIKPTSYNFVKKATEPSDLSTKEASVISKDIANWLSENYQASKTTISLFRKYRSGGLRIEEALREKGFGVIIGKYEEEALPVSYSIQRISKNIVLKLETGDNRNLHIIYRKSKGGSLEKIAIPTVLEKD